MHGSKGDGDERVPYCPSMKSLAEFPRLRERAHPRLKCGVSGLEECNSIVVNVQGPFGNPLGPISGMIAAASRMESSLGPNDIDDQTWFKQTSPVDCITD